MMRSLVFVVLGFLLGACWVNLLFARQQEQLHLDRAELELKLATAEEKIAQLEDCLAQETDRVITAIEPVVKFGDEKLTGTEARAAGQVISKEVKVFLDPLIGQEIRSLNAALIPNLVSGRRLNAAGREFELTVSLVLVSDTVVIYLQADEAK
ncbi:MAG: hypothetical protein GX952_03005 [Firmicutes bacterium]|nr:hypothetical protein [Bacillota bacterium]